MRLDHILNPVLDNKVIVNRVIGKRMESDTSIGSFEGGYLFKRQAKFVKRDPTDTVRYPPHQTTASEVLKKHKEHRIWPTPEHMAEYPRRIPYRSPKTLFNELFDRLGVTGRLSKPEKQRRD